MFVWHAVPCQSVTPGCGRGTLATWRVQVASDDVIQHRLPERHCHQPGTGVLCATRLQGLASRPVALQHGWKYSLTVAHCHVPMAAASCWTASHRLFPPAINVHSGGWQQRQWRLPCSRRAHIGRQYATVLSDGT
jgi:hypothetical protein